MRMMRTLAVLLLALCASALPGDRRRQRKRPNVVLMFADDLGFDLGCYGHPYARTPNLDRLAADGTVFTKFHVTGATCSPSRTGLMTGRHPSSFPNYPADFGFQGVPAVTDLVRGAGYAVGHFGKWHIGPDDSNGTYGIDRVEVIGGKARDPRGRDAATYEAARDFIRDAATASPARPFYVNIWGHISHSPVVPPESMVELFDDVAVDPDDFGRHMRDKMKNFERKRNGVDGSMREYLAEVWSLDLQVGMVLDLLDDLGIRDDTILAFASDHGPTPDYIGSSGPYRGGKHEFFEGGLRVPLILSWTAPGMVPAGTVNDESLLSSLDWAPTLCRILSLGCDLESIDGEDVSDVWLGRSGRSRVGPAFWSSSSSGGRLAMLYGRWKLHAQGSRRELYDLERNPEEDVNVYAQNRAVGDAMLATLEKWEDSLPRKYCMEKKGCGDALPFDPRTLPTVTCPSPELYEYRHRAETRGGQLIFSEDFEVGGGFGTNGRVRRGPAPELPAGARGSHVCNTTVPAFPGRRKTRHKTNIPLRGAGVLKVGALVGLGKEGGGTVAYRMMLKFDKGKPRKIYNLHIHHCGRKLFLEYDRVVKVPTGATSIRWVGLQFRNLSPGEPEQVAFVDDIKIAVLDIEMPFLSATLSETYDAIGNIFRIP